MNFLTSGNKLKGYEVLYFEDAEIEKYKGSYESFGAVGHLSVLYFKEYNRFVLELNDWKYPLLRRLPIVLTSDKNNTSHRIYTFPASNGFTYQLKINSIPNHQALINFETILEHNSIFSVKGEDTTMRKLESSPDDKLVRHHNKDTSAKEIISENIKSAVHKVMNKAATLKSGTKYLTSTKKRINLKDIKNKDFKKEAKSTFKKDFLRNGDIATYEFWAKRRNNKNMTEARELSQLIKNHEVPQLEVFREDLEECILRNKDLAISGKFAPIEKEQKKGLIQSMKEGITHLAQKAGGVRDTAATLKEEKLTTLESTHHSEA